MSDVDPEQKRHYEELANSTSGPLGDVYRMLSRPRMHIGGADAACQQFLIALELATSPEDLTDARAAIEAFEDGGWGMFAGKLRPALAAAEARLK
jgi:hypothetical protein